MLGLERARELDAVHGSIWMSRNSRCGRLRADRRERARAVAVFADHASDRPRPRRIRAASGGRPLVIDDDDIHHARDLARHEPAPRFGGPARQHPASMISLTHSVSAGPAASAARPSNCTASRSRTLLSPMPSAPAALPGAMVLLTLQDQRLVGRAHRDPHRDRALMAGEAVHHGVLDQRLQDQARHPGIDDVLRGPAVRRSGGRQSASAAAPGTAARTAAHRRAARSRARRRSAGGAAGRRAARPWPARDFGSHSMWPRMVCSRLNSVCGRELHAQRRQARRAPFALERARCNSELRNRVYSASP